MIVGFCLLQWEAGQSAAVGTGWVRVGIGCESSNTTFQVGWLSLLLLSMLVLGVPCPASSSRENQLSVTYDIVLSYFLHCFQHKHFSLNKESVI